MEPLARLIFDDDFSIDDHVEGLPGERLAAVINHHSDLAIDPMSLRNQVALHRESVDVLPISKAERAVNVAERINDCARCRRFEEGITMLVHPGTMIRFAEIAAIVGLLFESNECRI
jgi:hypothetical protein